MCLATVCLQKPRSNIKRIKKTKKSHLTRHTFLHEGVGIGHSALGIGRSLRIVHHGIALVGDSWLVTLFDWSLFSVLSNENQKQKKKYFTFSSSTKKKELQNDSNLNLVCAGLTLNPKTDSISRLRRDGQFYGLFLNCVFWTRHVRAMKEQISKIKMIHESIMSHCVCVSRVQVHFCYPRRWLV